MLYDEGIHFDEVTSGLTYFNYMCVFRSPRPIAVELLEQKDENDGLPEAFFSKSGDLLK